MKIKLQLLDDQYNVLISSTINEDTVETVKELHNVNILDDIYNSLKEDLNQNKMETKQKARKLVQRFIAHAYHNNNELQCKDHSKQCALIAVDEIIDSYIQEKNNGYIVSEKIIPYWEEVKQEIINL